MQIYISDTSHGASFIVEFQGKEAPDTAQLAYFRDNRSQLTLQRGALPVLVGKKLPRPPCFSIGSTGPYTIFCNNPFEVWDVPGFASHSMRIRQWWQHMPKGCDCDWVSSLLSACSHYGLGKEHPLCGDKTEQPQESFSGIRSQVWPLPVRSVP